MDVWQSLLIFSLETILILVAIVVVLGFIFANLNRSQHHNLLEVEKLNNKYDRMREVLASKALSKKNLKALHKEKKQKEKQHKKSQIKKHIYVLEFDGDIKATAVENLRHEVTAILTLAKPDDEVVVVIESPGGIVHGYGFAASQLERIRSHKLKLTTCIDKVAASGGYMMACVGDRILSSRFAIVGSVGVVAQVPNLHRLLKKHDVDYQEYTAGEYKRTVSILGEITPQGEQKFKEQLEATHILFKEHVSRFRHNLVVEKIATGEYWFGEQALKLGLVDELTTSDDYLLSSSQNADIYKVTYHHKKSFSEKISAALTRVLSQAFESALNTLSQKNSPQA